MQIKYLGGESFLIKGREGSVLTQPFRPEKGKNFPRVEADVILAPEGVPSNVRGRIKNKKGQPPLVFTGPGEYEVQGIEIWGQPGGFWLTIENRQLLWLFADKLGNNGQLKITLQPDILLLGLGQPGKGWDEQMKQLLEKLSPAVIIPFPRRSENGQPDAKWAQPLLDLLDMEKLAPQPNFVLKVDEKLGEERRLILLAARS